MSYFAQLPELKKQFEDLAMKAVEIAKSKGADEVRVRISGGKGLDVSSRHCEVENLEFNQMQGMSITVYKDKHCGHANTSDFSIASITDTAESALNLCNYTSRDEFAGLCDANELYQGDEDLELLYELEEDPDTLVKRAVDLDKLAVAMVDKNKDKGLKESDGASYSTMYSVRTLATSHGFCKSSVESEYSKYISLVGEQNGVMQRSGGSYIGINPALEWTDERVADEAVQRTLGKLGASKVKTGKYNIIFSRGAASELMLPFINAISGMLIYQNSSFLKDSLNSQVFPEFLSVKEDPLIKGGIASALFDAEGVATRPLDVVSNGVLKEFFIDTYSGRKLNMKCNGHNDPCYNIFFNPDDEHGGSLEDILKKAGSGIVVHQLMGQGVNIVNGNYSRGVSGYYFENGERVHAVDEITVAGNLKEMYASIAMIGNDRDERRRIQTGSVWIPELTVSGS
ncbi:MAG: metallopeptidase TldD-related protein [Anaerobiospirillum succiniciproducens]|uniref:metallopeptidase TldD-related protein n=1 Tax=Anaerobiospirillum succiniciproducens TaxID=13335 RepID=UPI0026DA9473|nr:metallopeptidase TldD-related protein [Anaerobiospirillum succiniciproducens]MDO4676431.1 metallopeptidase TldD-related protein [Anaerobiospirillum succiniciproducens]